MHIMHSIVLFLIINTKVAKKSNITNLLEEIKANLKINDLDLVREDYMKKTQYLKHQKKSQLKKLGHSN